MFLRSVSFDLIHGAQRIVKYFEQKLELFGMDKLVKSMTYNDLSEDDLEVLLSRCMQILPVPDSSGRKVVFSAPTYYYDKYKTQLNMVS
jgi:hypothetical protein